MSVRRRDYYDVVCDYPGCTTCTADYSDHSAWSEPSTAHDEWKCAPDQQALVYTVTLYQTPEPGTAVLPDEPEALIFTKIVHLCSEHRVTVPDELD